MAILKKLWRGFKRLRSKGDDYYARMRYSKYLKTLPIDEHAIVLEANQGLTFNGNMFYLLRELCKPEYLDYRLFFVIRQNNMARARDFFNAHGMESVEIVQMFSDDYYRLVASAKYLVTDVAFLPFFVKRKEQVYLNTWHGTPLKTLGKECKTTAHTIGNVQRNFALANYIVSPNEFTRNHLRDDYMLNNIAHPKMVLEGYPRNEVFLDNKQREHIREEMGFEDDLDIIAFMPTWREYVGFENRTAQAYLLYYLSEIDKRLDDSHVMYVNLHPRSRENVDFSYYRHIRPFPEQYETYEFLNACDCLITDYSSVMFDYMNTRRPIVLFAYDLEQYKENRGLYFDIEELGIPVAKTLEDLWDYLNGSRRRVSDSTVQRFTAYDGLDASRRICQLLLEGEGAYSGTVEVVPDNGKPNVLVYAGALERNGITSSLKNMLSSVDHTKANYYFALERRMQTSSIDILSDLLNSGVSYISMVSKMNLSLVEKTVHYLYINQLIPFGVYWFVMKQHYTDEVSHMFSAYRIDKVIQFTGYNWKRTLLFSRFKCFTGIFVHNDMVQEIKTRKNARKSVLRYAYRNYDKVALVAGDMKDPTEHIAGRKLDVTVVPNSFDYKQAFERSHEPIAFDDFTKSNHSLDEIIDMLNNSKQKIVSVGRFSPEKGHKRLVRIFGEMHNRYRESVLMIIGSRSTLMGGCSFDDMCSFVENAGMNDQVILIENISNPYPLMKQCTGFILPSFYEAFPMVIPEADTLNLPVAITDLPGPRGFVKDNGGFVADNTDSGVEQALTYLLSGNAKTLDVDYEQYNMVAVQAFESMLNL